MQGGEIVGFIAIFLMGGTLGLIGAGGSILTVPILVYLFGFDPTLATAYSLVLVGSTAATGSIRNLAKGQFDKEAFLSFGIPSVLSVYLVRRYFLPALPDSLGEIGTFEVTKSGLIMVVFAGLMMLAALLMIKGDARPKDEGDSSRKRKSTRYGLVCCEGLFTGALTGMVGAGGGFLIVPALVWLMKLPIKLAISTSLLIITTKSLIGFVGDLQVSRAVDWPFLAVLLVLSSAGIFAGGYLSRKVSSQQLRLGFGWFVLVAGASILLAELSA